MPLQPRQVHGDARPQIDADHVARPAGADARDLLPRDDDALGEQEADGQLAVVAGRAHRDRDAAVDPSPVNRAPQTDFQRLLHSQKVRLDRRAGAVNSAHGDGGHGLVGRGIDLVGDHDNAALAMRTADPRAGFMVRLSRKRQLSIATDGRRSQPSWNGAG